MDESAVGLLVFGLIAVISSIGWHIFVSQYRTAVIRAAITSVILFQIAAYIHLGHLDPFFIVAVVTTGVISLAVAALIGLPFRTLRENNSD